MKEIIPDTDSIKELAEFWDIHDVTDFENELEEVQESVFEHHTKTNLTIQLNVQEAEKLKKLAHDKDMTDSSLMREWVLEKLQHA